MNKIAIIPARSGSKGLKDKNIIDLCGRPLMAYSIEAAIKSSCFNRVIVSTDSEEYGKIAKQYGAEVMYRGAKLSDDKATTFMVLEDILDRLKEPLDYFMLLQPTSPLRDENHVREAVDKFERNMPNFDFLVSVKEAEHSAVLVKPIDEDESLKYFDTDFPITEDRHIRNIHLMVRYSLPNRMHILAGNIFSEQKVYHIL